jgi:hypothetical protein
MGMTTAGKQALLDLLFLNTNFANIGDASGLRGSVAAGSFYVALHTADPGDAGNQSTSEVAYTGYARVQVDRSGSVFSRTGIIVSNIASVLFGECTAGSATATHFSVGVSASGANLILVKGALAATRSISAGITPLFNPGELDATAA